MEIEHLDVDFGGARGSNTGDVFHELWAVRHALRLLDATDDLTAVKVEGVPTIGNTERAWDGVDCTLLFGGENLIEADRVELQQLKYSAANPEKKWTVARVCSGKSGNPKTSLMSRLGAAYKTLMKSREGKELDTVSISLVTNQPVSTDLVQIMESARDGVSANFDGPWTKAKPPLHRLVQASALDAAEFSRFAHVMDFRGETGSRFSIEEGVLRGISQWNDTEFSEVALRLRHFVRNRMLPETAKELITKERVLLLFGVSDERALFPCPSSIRTVEDAVSRRAARVVASAMTEGVVKICFHGGAGVGKTTALQEITSLLPHGSEMIVFDCYGAGSYLDASKLRHRPKEAFVQLANETSQRVGLPALLVPGPGQDLARAFRRRLELAAETLAGACPEGLLILAIDAADNSITAASTRAGADTSFVTELMSIGDLPPNVRIIVSARTGKLEELNAPSEYREVELRAFCLAETADNVTRYWDATPDWIEDFHFLSSGVPRVQGYAFGQASDDFSAADEYLRPCGKSLGEVFGELFHEALSKAGRPEAVEMMCAGLTVLPRPIPVAELAHAMGASESEVLDICTDLAPGVRSQEGFLSFADEDFEAYVRQQGTRFEQSILTRSAERILANAGSDEYAALNVADQLFAAGNANDLLELVEREPEPSGTVIPDPVLRREVRDQRLLTAVRVCREAGEVARALRFVLIAAEAVGSSEATRSLLTANPGLTAKFAPDTGSRLILENPDYVSEHGRLLLCSLAEHAANGDRVAVREVGRRLRAWFQARDDHRQADNIGLGREAAWPVNGEDVAASLLATGILLGADAAVAEFEAWSPFGFRIRVAKAFVERLLAENRFELAEEIAHRCRSWQSGFLLVPLARTGRNIDLEQLATSLTGIKKRFPLNAKTLGRHYEDGDTGPYVVDTVLSGAEILSGYDSHRELATSVLAPFLDPELRRLDKRHEFEVALLDAILRAYCLSEVMNGNTVDASNVLTVPLDPKHDTRRDERRRHDYGHDRRMNDLMSEIAPIYANRAKIMVGANGRERENIDLDMFGKSLGGYRLELSHYGSRFRAVLGERLVDLVAAGANSSEVMERALGFRRGLWPEGPGGAGELCVRLAAIPALHDALIYKISEAARLTVDERIRAHDKSRTLAAYAALLVPISPNDAKIVFQMAVGVASELDTEAAYQIRLVGKLIERGQNGFGEGTRAYALMVAEIVSDAAIRLGDQDHFPWEAAMSSIARLDAAVALTSVARWEDSGVQSIDMTLAPVVAVGLQDKYFNSAQGAALVALDVRPSFELLQILLDEAQGESSALVSELAEELAHDSVVGRIPYERSLEALIATYGKGKWAVEFKARAEFCRTSEDKKAIRSQEWKDPGKAYPEFFAMHEWDVSRLVDADTLLTDAMQVVDRLRDTCGRGSLRRVLVDATGAVPPGKRTAYLDALAGVLENESDGQIVDVILSALNAWKNQFAVGEWCNEKLSGLLVRHLPFFVRYLPWEDSRISSAMDIMVHSGCDPVSHVLKGIERNVEFIRAETIFALAGLIGSRLDPMDSADLCKWYVERLLARVPERDRESVVENNVPVRASETVGRFLFAYLSDVDLRQRWRAAHGLRRLARLGEESALRETVAQYERLEEPAFRALGQPFYWLAARLWLVIALDRISGETAEAVKPYAQKLLAICFCEDFPHLLIRDYAADACRKLVASGHLHLGAGQTSKLDIVNRGLISEKPGAEIEGRSLRSYRRDKSESRFDFDPTDTMSYWYDGWLRLFDGVPPHGFVSVAEEWIVDKWSVTEQPSRRTEPRLNRFSDGSYHLWSHSHGSLPTLERYQTHLEWHAMWCAAGQLAKTHPVVIDEFGDGDAFRSRISERKLTHAPYWMSDLAAPPPLQKHRSNVTAQDVEQWLCDVVDKDFLRELFPDDRTGWVCVSADIKAVSCDRGENVKISTALVSPNTACALVRALQTVGNCYQFYICPEGHDSEIDDPQYELRGWLTGGEGDLKFDKKDPYCGAAGSLHGLPGTNVTRALGLTKRYCGGPLKWFREGSDTASFVFEAWGPREQSGPSARHGDPANFSGYRLLVTKDHLAEFLQAERRDLIAEIEVTRHDRQRSRSPNDSEDAKRDVFDRIVLLRGSGTIEAAERSFGAWHKDSS